MTGITSFGAYIPRLRLQRKAMAQANAWFAPGLMGAAKGERAMANFDEDAVTMAVEAGRDCLPASDPIAGRAFVDAAYFASTTMPFSDRQNAGIVARALNLPEAISSFDVTSSQRAGTSALIAALDAVASGRAKAPLVVAGEKRKARAASPQEMAYGDAAAAFTLGNDKVVAKFLGAHSVTVDFVDHFAGSATRAIPRSCPPRSRRCWRRPASRAATSPMSSCHARSPSSTRRWRRRAASIPPGCATISRALSAMRARRKLC